MPTRIFQSANSTLFPLIALLCLESFVQCQINRERWSIEYDINRLLSNEDARIFQEDSTQNDSINGTKLTNFTSNDNATSYWHLPADAPLLEQPTLDVPQSVSSTKQIIDSSLKSGTVPFACSHFSVLPLRPLLEFVIYLCGSLILGFSSCVWIILVGRKRCKQQLQQQREALSDKCRLVLGLNIHATVCAIVFLILQAASRGTLSFATLSSRQASNFCNVAISVLDICTSVFWLFIGMSNIFLTVFLRALKPGVSRTEPCTSLFKSRRKSIFLSLLTHCIPWVCGIALNTLQLVFLNESFANFKAFHHRSQLLRALTIGLAVVFAFLTISIRIWKFQGHRLHLPSLSRVVPSYSCQQEYSEVRIGLYKNQQSPSASSHTDGAGSTCIALFSSTIASAVHFTCSLIATITICLWITSISLSDLYILLRIQAVLMYLVVGFLYALALAGYNNRLTLASAITTRNSYIPGESLRLHEDRSCANQSEDKLSPRELIEIPQFTRIHFFDTSSPEINERDQVDHCVTTPEPVQFIAVYEPIVS